MSVTPLSATPEAPSGIPPELDKKPVGLEPSSKDDIHASIRELLAKPKGAQADRPAAPIAPEVTPPPIPDFLAKADRVLEIERPAPAGSSAETPPAAPRSPLFPPRRPTLDVPGRAAPTVAPKLAAVPAAPLSLAESAPATPAVNESGAVTPLSAPDVVAPPKPAEPPNNTVSADLAKLRNVSQEPSDIASAPLARHPEPVAKMPEPALPSAPQAPIVLTNVKRAMAELGELSTQEKRLAANYTTYPVQLRPAIDTLMDALPDNIEIGKWIKTTEPGADVLPFYLVDGVGAIPLADKDALAAELDRQVNANDLKQDQKEKIMGLWATLNEQVQAHVKQSVEQQSTAPAAPEASAAQSGRREVKLDQIPSIAKPPDATTVAGETPTPSAGSEIPTQPIQGSETQLSPKEQELRQSIELDIEQLGRDFIPGLRIKREPGKDWITPGNGTGNKHVQLNLEIAQGTNVRNFEAADLKAFLDQHPKESPGNNKYVDFVTALGAWDEYKKQELQAAPPSPVAAPKSGGWWNAIKSRWPFGKKKP